MDKETVSLSEKIEEAKKHLAKECLVNEWWAVASLQKDIREAVLRLKEETTHFDGWYSADDAKAFRGLIDEIFGEKLSQ